MFFAFISYWNSSPTDRLLSEYRRDFLQVYILNLIFYDDTKFKLNSSKVNYFFYLGKINIINKINHIMFKKTNDEKLK